MIQNVQTGKSREIGDQRLPGAVGWDSLCGDRSRWHNMVNVLNATDLFTLKWLIVWYMNFAPVIITIRVFEVFQQLLSC